MDQLPRDVVLQIATYLDYNDFEDFVRVDPPYWTDSDYVRLITARYPLYFNKNVYQYDTGLVYIGLLFVDDDINEIIKSSQSGAVKRVLFPPEMNNVTDTMGLLAELITSGNADGVGLYELYKYIYIEFDIPTDISVLLYLHDDIDTFTKIMDRLDVYSFNDMLYDSVSNNASKILTHILSEYKYFENTKTDKRIINLYNGDVKLDITKILVEGLTLKPMTIVHMFYSSTDFDSSAYLYKHLPPKDAISAKELMKLFRSTLYIKSNKIIALIELYESVLTEKDIIKLNNYFLTSTYGDTYYPELSEEGNRRDLVNIVRFFINHPVIVQRYPSKYTKFKNE